MLQYAMSTRHLARQLKHLERLKEGRRLAAVQLRAQINNRAHINP